MVPKKALWALVIGSLTLLASPAFAAKGFSYSYLDVGYEYTDIDESDDGSSFKLASINASFDTFKHVALRAGFKRGRLEGLPKANGSDDDPDFTEGQAGGWGHYTLMKKKLDVFAGANWFYNSINSSSSGVSSTSDAGFIFDAGVRFRALKWLELDMAGEHRSGDFDDNVLVVGSRFKARKKLWINLKTKQLGDNDTYFAGIRWDM
ncbi:MAG: outer membrane beta-barrel protein [Thiogranum sp.]